MTVKDAAISFLCGLPVLVLAVALVYFGVAGAENIPPPVIAQVVVP